MSRASSIGYCNYYLSEDVKREIIATVVQIAVEFMFNSHIYTFGGKLFKQKSGGPIGLRGTCAVARLIMQVWDSKWMARLDKLKVLVELAMRYMDDGRTLLHPFKAGWRWVNEDLLYCKKWEMEDSALSPVERTKRVIHGTMGGLEDFLTFTMETQEDFPSGWLATLDTDLQVTEENRVEYKYYEKPMSSNMVMQKSSAMDENTKMKILANDLTRRLLNTSESLGMDAKISVVDQYSQKLMNSGFRVEQIRRIVINGIKAYEKRVQESRSEGGRRLHRTAGESSAGRIRKKLLGKSEWFKKRKQKGLGRAATTLGSAKTSSTSEAVPFKEQRGGKRAGSSRSSHSRGEEIKTNLKTRTVLFIEQTKDGKLAKLVREVLRRLEPMMGFKVKVAERAGNCLKNTLPCTNPWAGEHCTRTECVTCNQQAEERPDCFQRNLVYENICTLCNPEALKSG